MKGRSRHRQVSARPLTHPMPPLSKAPYPCEVPLASVIENARLRLGKETVAYHPWSRNRSEKREVKLALANVKTGEIKIASGWIKQQTLFLEGSDIRFEVEWWNGFNSSINILEPARTAVVALLYALEPERQKFLGRPAVLYTPYSSALLQPELVQAGRSYLLDKISRACTELGQVKSRVFSEKSLMHAPFFTREDYSNVILAEQMDPGRFCSIVSESTRISDRQEEELMRLAERILVIIGANRKDAYNFTGSCAGARGLTQFTTPGMAAVWNNYPDSGITRNFRKATGDHVSAIKAEICLLDNYAAELIDAYPKLMWSGYEKYAAAAAYNGGPERVVYGLEHFGVRWLNPRARLAQLSEKKDLTRNERLEYQWLTRNQCHETFIYLMKLHAIERFQKNQRSSSTPVRTVANVPPIEKSSVQ
ncbi:MAG: hypothetical protein NTZ51_00930 [Proteobacteria bacterium]|nr:hypothetical protein [Pseudomonadota bacterium]